MNNSKILIVFLFILINFSCKSPSSQVVEEAKGVSSVNFANPVEPHWIIGEVLSINLNNSVYEILIKDSSGKSYKILSKELNRPNENSEIVVGNKYDFKLTQLTHIKGENQGRRMVVNGKEIIIGPNGYIRDCIMYNGQEFCNDSWEVYEGLNLKGLRISE